MSRTMNRKKQFKFFNGYFVNKGTFSHFFEEVLNASPTSYLLLPCIENGTAKRYLFPFLSIFLSFCSLPLSFSVSLQFFSFFPLLLPGKLNISGNFLEAPLPLYFILWGPDETFGSGHETVQQGLHAPRRPKRVLNSYKPSPSQFSQFHALTQMTGAWLQDSCLILRLLE